MDGRGEKEESQGQKNCGRFLTHAPWTKIEKFVYKIQMDQWYQMGFKLIKGKYERPAVAVAGW